MPRSRYAAWPARASRGAPVDWTTSTSGASSSRPFRFCTVRDCLLMRLTSIVPRLLANFRWILVDEYQDIGPDEYALISALAGRTLVG